MSKYFNFLAGLGLQIIQAATKDLDERIKEQEREKRRIELRKGSIDVEYKVKEDK